MIYFPVVRPTNYRICQILSSPTVMVTTSLLSQVSELPSLSMMIAD